MMADKKICAYDIDYMKLLYENDNISIYELDAIHLGVNRSNMSIDEDCVRKSLPSFADAPLYCVIDNQFNPLDGAHNDFLEHFREEYPHKISRDRILPFGTVPESAISSASFVTRPDNDKTYLRIQVVVWKRLLPHVSDILKRRDGSVKISVEYIIEDCDVDKTTGVLNIRKFTITAITALGAKFTEVMEGAMLKSVKFAFNDYFKNCNESYCAFSNDDEIKVPCNVLNAIKDGISVREKYGRGGTVGLYNNMCHAVDSGSMFKSQVVEMNAYFSSISDIPEDSRTKTNRYIIYKMFGSEDGRAWANSVCNGGSADVISKSERRTIDLVEGVKNSENKIRINNTKGSAVDSESWTNPGKKLYEPLFESANVNSLIYEAYLVAEDGFQDAPSEKLKYPHHLIKNGELVIDIAGVKAALARAVQQGIFEDKAVYDHLKRHYEELDLDIDKFESKNAIDEEVKEKAETEVKEEKEIEKNAEGEATVEEKEVEETEDNEDDNKDEKEDIVKNASDELVARCAALEKEKKEMAARLAEYTKREDAEVSKMAIEDYGHCFSESVRCELMAKSEELGREEFQSVLCSKVMEFARAIKENAQEKSAEMPEIQKNAFYNFKKDIKSNTVSDIDGVIKRQKTRVI